ncbi:hypothetical protein [Pseudoduganella rhizocola]|uniref:hypothetical protein n=1 Tax=Pseudoduganella rhizocola TaxID=3382643 RepID=UPI0038B58173
MSKQASNAGDADIGEVLDALAQLAARLLEINGLILQKVVQMCRQMSDDGTELDIVLRMQDTPPRPPIPMASLAISARSFAGHARQVHCTVKGLTGAEPVHRGKHNQLTLAGTASSLQDLYELLKMWEDRSAGGERYRPLRTQVAHMASVAAGNLHIAHQALESLRSMAAAAQQFASAHLP